MGDNMNKYNNFNHDNFQSKKSNLRNNIKGVDKVLSKTGSSQKELAQTLTKMGKLTGNKKEAYIGELVSRNNSIAFATDLLTFMNTMIIHTSKLDLNVTLGYQTTISRLLDRLDKLNEEENPTEIEKIYYLISDLSNKILQVNRDTKKMIMYVISGALSIAAVLVKPVIDNKYKNF